MISFYSRLVLIASVLPLVSACGTDALAGGQRKGEVRAVAMSEPDASRGSAARAALLPAGGGLESAADPQGTVQFQASVRLVADSGEEVPLTNGFVPASVQITGADSALLARDSVEARTYSRVRVSFGRVSGNVTGGLIVNGIPLLGEVRVQIAEGSPLVVERTLPVTVTAREAQTLVIDLNAHAWLTAAVGIGIPGQTPSVPAAAFQSAVEVRVRS